MTQEPIAFAGVVRRGWAVVLVAVLVGVAVAYAATRKMPTTTFTGSQRVTISGTAAGPQNPPGPDDLVGAATLSIVRRSAAESLGLDPNALDGVVAAKTDSGDRRTVVFTAKAGSEEEARLYSRAIAQAAAGYILRRFDVYLAVQDDIVARMSARKAELEARERELKALAAKASGAERGAYEQAVVANRNQLFAATDAIATAANAARQVRESMVLGENTVSKSTTGGLALSALLQGALVGFLIGSAAVAIRERLRARGATAA